MTTTQTKAPGIIIDASKKREGDSGNTQVDGTTVHSDDLAARAAERDQIIAEVGQGDLTPGATVRAHKARMIDTAPFDKAHPEYHHRFVNVKNTDKATSRMIEGYVAVPMHDPKSPNPKHYGRRLGDELVLMRIPRAQYNARMAEIRRTTSSRERAHVDEVEAVADQVLHALRARGMNVPARARVLINEGG
jgi:hypothetical protein